MSDAPDPEVVRLRHELLRVTDRALGAEAAEAQARVELDALLGVRAERDALRKRVAAMQASTTWRVGRAVLKPVSAVARRRRRR